MRIPLSYNLRNLFARKTTTLLTASGIALTVAVLVTVLAMNSGLRRSLEASGHPLHLLVMRRGSTSELTSVINRETYQIVRAHAGVVASSLEIVSGISLGSGDSGLLTITLRGLLPEGFELRERARVTEGRLFAEGRREMVVGRAVARKFPNVRLGSQVRFGRGVWTVVGVLDAGQAAANNEVFADLNQVAADLGRPQALSTILVRAAGPVEMAAVKNALEQDRRLNVVAQPEQAYYESQMISAVPLQFMGSVVTALLAIGSCFSAMNTMYAAVARRTPEIATLRILGFSRGSILSSFLIESVALSLIGGGLGCLLAFPLHNLDTAIGNFVTFTEFSFRLTISAPIVLTGLGAGTVMGVLGGLLPAWSASRRGVLEALRAA